MVKIFYIIYPKMRNLIFNIIIFSMLLLFVQQKAKSENTYESLDFLLKCNNIDSLFNSEFYHEYNKQNYDKEWHLELFKNAKYSIVNSFYLNFNQKNSFRFFELKVDSIYLDIDKYKVDTLKHCIFILNKINESNKFGGFFVIFYNKLNQQNIDSIFKIYKDIKKYLQDPKSLIELINNNRQIIFANIKTSKKDKIKEFFREELLKKLDLNKIYLKSDEISKLDNSWLEKANGYLFVRKIKFGIEDQPDYSIVLRLETKNMIDWLVEDFKIRHIDDD
jgi:hypothetical protein